MTIEAVVFDFGGVFTASPFTGHPRLARGEGTRPGAGVRVVFGPYDQDTDHPWHQLERGEIALAGRGGADQGRRRRAGARTRAVRDVRARWAAAGVRTDMVDKVLELRAAGYRTALITNNIKEFSDGWRAMIPIDDMFDVIVDSSEVGMRKPDHRIYR